MDDAFLERLRRLGVAKGVRNLKPAPPGSPAPPSMAGSPAASGSTTDLALLLPGGFYHETDAGRCFVLDHVFPLDHAHGSHPLADLLAFAPSAAASYLADERLREMSFSDFLFIDTETTGLWGAGVLAFMVGAAFFEDAAFVVRQFFLPEPADEPALLLLLEELLASKAGLITFNGRGFDIPLLGNRFLMNRMHSDIRERPHLDLLLPARRLWRNRLGSCALQALEERLLNVARTEQDIDSARIPWLYREFVQSGDPREMLRVFYHNRIDMLSMVVLAAEIMKWLTTPDSGDHPLDFFGLARWQLSLNMAAEAEQNLRRAAAPELPTDFYQRVLGQLALVLKRQQRRQEALLVWQQMASTSFEDVTAHVELAKHFEWHEKAFYDAIQWTSQALSLVDLWPDADRADEMRRQLHHRLRRLTRKFEATGDEHFP